MLIRKIHDQLQYFSPPFDAAPPETSQESTTLPSADQTVSAVSFEAESSPETVDYPIEAGKGSDGTDATAGFNSSADAQPIDNPTLSPTGIDPEPTVGIEASMPDIEPSDSGPSGGIGETPDPETQESDCEVNPEEDPSIDSCTAPSEGSGASDSSRENDGLPFSDEDVLGADVIGVSSTETTPEEEPESSGADPDRHETLAPTEVDDQASDTQQAPKENEKAVNSPPLVDSPAENEPFELIGETVPVTMITGENDTPSPESIISPSPDTKGQILMDFLLETPPQKPKGPTKGGKLPKPRKEEPKASSIVKVYALQASRHKLTIRGDAPLSWDKGEPLHESDLGQFDTLVPPFSGTLRIRFFIDDRAPCREPWFEVKSGQTIECYPDFGDA